MVVKVITEIGLETTTCITCGVVYAMPEKLLDFHRLHGNTHYCPNGHGQVFCEPEVEVLNRKLRAAQDRTNQLEYQLNGALTDIAEKKKELRRVKRKVNAGLCPYCRRHFTNLERHVHSKHPEELNGKEE